MLSTRRNERLPHRVGTALSERFVILRRADRVRMPYKLHPTDFAGLCENTPRPKRLNISASLGWTEIRFVEGEANDVRGHRHGLRRLAEAVQPCRPPYELALIDTGTVVAKHIWFVTLSQASYEIHDVILRFFTLLKDKCP